MLRLQNCERAGREEGNEAGKRSEMRLEEGEREREGKMDPLRKRGTMGLMGEKAA